MQVKKALAALLQNSEWSQDRRVGGPPDFLTSALDVVSAPLWDSEKHKFAGMLTVSDIINLIQYYYQMDKTYGDAEKDVERFQLSGLREVEAAIEVPSPSLYSAHPQDRLFEVCKLLSETHARRLPLLDRDEESGMETIVSVVTQYRVLKFIAMNCRQATMLRRSVKSLGIGTYVPQIATATMQTTVFDVVHLFAKGGISAVPIVDENGVVVNLYETVDVMVSRKTMTQTEPDFPLQTLVRTGAYHSLDLTIAEAILRRSSDFAGVRTCTADDSLANILELIRRERVHRFVIVQSEEEAHISGDDPSSAAQIRGKLVGMLTLSDVLKYLING